MDFGALRVDGKMLVDGDLMSSIDDGWTDADGFLEVNLSHFGIYIQFYDVKYIPVYMKTLGRFD